MQHVVYVNSSIFQRIYVVFKICIYLHYKNNFCYAGLFVGAHLSIYLYLVLIAIEYFLSLWYNIYGPVGPGLVACFIRAKKKQTTKPILLQPKLIKKKQKFI